MNFKWNLLDKYYIIKFIKIYWYRYMYLIMPNYLTETSKGKGSAANIYIFKIFISFC